MNFEYLSANGLRDQIIASVESDWMSIEKQLADMRTALEMYAKREWDYGHLAREILAKYNKGIQS